MMRRERTDQLTKREREVLAAIGRGMSNNEIADELFLGVSTVKSHVNTLFAKLGVRDRAQAVVMAYESGLVQVGRREPRTAHQTSRDRCRSPDVRCCDRGDRRRFALARHGRARASPPLRWLGSLALP